MCIEPKQKMSDTSYQQNSITINNEPTAFPVKKDKNNEYGDSRDKSKMHEETNENNFAYVNVKPEYNIENVKECQQDTLTINDIKIENIKKEYSFLENVKDTFIVEDEYVGCYNRDIGSGPKAEGIPDNIFYHNQNFTDITEKSKQDPLSIDDSDVKNVKKEYMFARDENGETLTELHEIPKYSTSLNSKYNIAEYKIEPSIVNDVNLVRSVNDGSAPSGSSSTERDQTSMIDQEAHKRIKCYACNKCHKMFSQAVSLKRHIDCLHKGIRKYECKDCHKMFSRVDNLKLHIDIVHKGIKKYECDMCCKVFSQVSHLKSHIDCFHSGLKKYKCNECHKKFSQSNGLKKHVDSLHKGIKKYECDMCHKMFSEAGNLKKHINFFHKRIKKYKCNECNKAFTHVSSLKLHIDCFHTRSGNYECYECHKMFPTFGLVKTHIGNVHKVIKKFKCFFCHDTFSRFKYVKKHISEIHEEIM